MPKKRGGRRGSVRKGQQKAKAKKANKTRRSLLTGGALYVADKVAGGVIGAGAVTVLSKFAATSSTTAVVVSSGVALSIATGTAAAAIEGHPPLVKVNGPGGIRAAERDADSHRDTGGSPLPMF